MCVHMSTEELPLLAMAQTHRGQGVGVTSVLVTDSLYCLHGLHT